MAEPRSDDRSQVRREAAVLLGVDIERLSPADSLRVDMISALRLVIDHEQAAVLDGSTADLGKLNVAVASLIALLPGRELPKPTSSRVDPRAEMWRIYQTMRERGEIADRAEEPSLRERIAALEAENALLRAGPTPAEPSTPMPAGPNVLRLSRPGPKSAPAASAAPKLNQPVVALSGDETKARMDRVNAQPLPRVDTRPANEPWRNFTRIDWQG
jgi:hypothetical protein